MGDTVGVACHPVVSHRDPTAGCLIHHQSVALKLTETIEQGITIGALTTVDIQDILQQLEVNDGTFPREAVVQAIEQREAMTPELLRILEYAHDNIEDIAERPDYFAHIYAMYLLAEFREVRAYPLLTQFFSIPGNMAADVTGEVVTSDLCRILA